MRTAPEPAISVDTFKPSVAAAVLEAGAHVINDVSGLRDPQDRYTDIAGEVAAFIARQVDTAIGLGIAPESVVVDPGPDFTKTPAQTIAVLRGIAPVVALGYPVLLALSGKDFVGALTSRRPADRDAGTLGAVAALRHVPRQILRVHNVAATADMLAMFEMLTGETPVPPRLAMREEIQHRSESRTT